MRNICVARPWPRFVNVPVLQKLCKFVQPPQVLTISWISYLFARISLICTISATAQPHNRSAVALIPIFFVPLLAYQQTTTKRRHANGYKSINGTRRGVRKVTTMLATIYMLGARIISSRWASARHQRLIGHATFACIIRITLIPNTRYAHATRYRNDCKFACVCDVSYLCEYSENSKLFALYQLYMHFSAISAKTSNYHAIVLIALDETTTSTIMGVVVLS